MKKFELDNHIKFHGVLKPLVEARTEAYNKLRDFILNNELVMIPMQGENEFFESLKQVDKEEI